jgi:hypothetical protein
MLHPSSGWKKPSMKPARKQVASRAIRLHRGGGGVDSKSVAVGSLEDGTDRQYPTALIHNRGTQSGPKKSRGSGNTVVGGWAEEKAKERR